MHFDYAPNLEFVAVVAIKEMCAINVTLLNLFSIWEHKTVVFLGGGPCFMIVLLLPVLSML